MNISKSINQHYPAGAYVEIGTLTIPFGFLLCDGSYVLRSDYARLFESIGTTYNLGGDVDVTKFRLPNIKGKSSIGEGAGAGLSNRILGVAGGEKDHTITEAEMPSHTHAQNPHSHSISNLTSGTVVSGTNASGAIGASSSGSANTTAVAATNQNTGGGLSHNNMQPYVVINSVIKY